MASASLTFPIITCTGTWNRHFRYMRLCQTNLAKHGNSTTIYPLLYTIELLRIIVEIGTQYSGNTFVKYG